MSEPASGGAIPPRSALRPVDPTTASLLLASLASTLEDGNEDVHERALKAIAQIDEPTVEAWARQVLRTGTTADATHAAAVVRHRRMHGLATAVLERGAAAGPAHVGPFMSTFAALGLPVAEAADCVRAVAPSWRHEALRWAWRHYGDAVAPHVADLLHDSVGAVRTVALEVAGAAGGEAALHAAAHALAADSSPAVRTTAARVLSTIGTDEALSSLAGALHDPDPDVRAAAVQALVLGRSPAPAVIQAALRDPEERVWRTALERLADSSEPSLVWTAMREAPAAQQDRFLALLETRRPEALGPLAVEQLGSPQPSDRLLAARLAGVVGSPDCVGRLIDALADPSPEVRQAAAHELAGLRSPEAVPALRDAMLDPDPRVRTASVSALGLIDDDEVIPVLVGALTDPDDQVRRRAATVVGRWSSPAVARELVGYVARSRLDAASVDLLVAMGEAAVAPLVEAARAADPEAAPTLGRLLHRIAGVDRFLAQRQALDPEARLQALDALGAMGGDDALVALTEALSDPHVANRLRAIELLARIDEDEARDAIAAAATTDPVPEVKLAATRALEAPTASDATPVLDLTDRALARVTPVAVV